MSSSCLDACCLCPQMTIWECAGRKWADSRVQSPSAGSPGHLHRMLLPLWRAWGMDCALPCTGLRYRHLPGPHSEILPSGSKSVLRLPVLDPQDPPKLSPSGPLCPSPFLNLDFLGPKSQPKDLSKPQPQKTQGLDSAGVIVPVP